MTVNKKTDQKILKTTQDYVREMREANPELWRSFYEQQSQLLKEARDSSRKSK